MTDTFPGGLTKVVHTKFHQKRINDLEFGIDDFKESK